MLYQVESLENRVEKKEGRQGNWSARWQISVNQKYYFFKLEKGICESGEGQDLLKAILLSIFVVHKFWSR